MVTLILLEFRKLLLLVNVNEPFRTNGLIISPTAASAAAATVLPVIVRLYNGIFASRP